MRTLQMFNALRIFIYNNQHRICQGEVYGKLLNLYLVDSQRIY